MNKRSVILVLAVAMLFVGSVAQAQSDDEAKRDNAAANGGFVPHGPPLPSGGACDNIDITGVLSRYDLGTPGNTIISADYSAGPCLSVDDIGWTGVIFTAIAPSWGSEGTLEVSASDGSSASSIQFFPGDTAPGTYGPTAGSTGAPVVLLGDQILRLEFWESFDDAAVDPDGIYDAGQIDVFGAVVPVELQTISID